jgi:hypothetical protein
MAIRKDLLADHGFCAGYGSVKRFVRKLQGNQPIEARAVIFTAPGQERKSITVLAPWSAIPKAGNIGAHDCS